MAILGGGSLVLGLAVDSSGNLLIAAPGAVLDISGTIIAGNAGATYISVENGAASTSPGIRLAVQSTALASVYIASAGSLSVSGSLVVGQDGSASVLVTSQGTLRAADLVLGEFAGGSGIVTNSGGSLTVEGSLLAGDGGSGSLIISNAGVATSASGEVGTGAGNTGSLIVDRHGSSWAITDDLTIGVAGGIGTTSATISSQASITTTNPNNFDYLNSGMLTLEAGGQLIEIGLDMHDAATLAIESGATLAEIATSTPSNVYTGLLANGTVTIDDGTLASAGEYIVVGETATTGSRVNAPIAPVIRSCVRRGQTRLWHGFRHPWNGSRSRIQLASAEARADRFSEQVCR